MRKEEMLTTQEIASEFDVAYQTVMAWIYKGFFPHAQKEETPRGAYYLVPRSDLRDFKVPKRGRPSKDAEKQGEQTAEESTPAQPTRKASKRSPPKKANVTKSAKKKGIRAK